MLPDEQERGHKKPDVEKKRNDSGDQVRKQPGRDDYQDRRKSDHIEDKRDPRDKKR